ncbi:MAG: methyltransferase domain-containing protein [Hyphomicrobiales bacterium]
MAHADSGELYGNKLIRMLEIVWGDGWLSPGGPDEVDRVVSGLDLAGKSIMDIGSGAGGIDIQLVRQHAAGHVTGIDVEDTVIATARAKVEAAGLAGRIGFAKVAPGPFPFPPSCFDLVFSKDSIVHIPDKHALAREVFRVLKPGGWFAASDWLIGHDGEPSAPMKAYIAAEGLDFGMASPGRYRAALEAAGFSDIAITSRNAWYRDQARKEVEAMRGPLYARACAELGQDFVDHNIEIWDRMLGVLESGEHCPTHIRARRPAA